MEFNYWVWPSFNVQVLDAIIVCPTGNQTKKISMSWFNVIIRESVGNDWSSEYPLKLLYIVSDNTIE